MFTPKQNICVQPLSIIETSVSRFSMIISGQWNFAAVWHWSFTVSAVSCSCFSVQVRVATAIFCCVSETQHSSILIFHTQSHKQTHYQFSYLPPSALTAPSPSDSFNFFSPVSLTSVVPITCTRQFLTRCLSVLSSLFTTPWSARSLLSCGPFDCQWQEQSPMSS